MFENDERRDEPLRARFVVSTGAVEQIMTQYRNERTRDDTLEHVATGGSAGRKARP
jgi:hypothetical protein